MPTLNYSDLFGSDSNSLRVPQSTESMTAYEAALAWTEGGFYVLPINNASKHAGSVVGKGWPEKSSREPAQIKAWFDGKEHGLAIHVGRSGALAIDVDAPELLQEPLLSLLRETRTPFQSTRTDGSLRGHYLFATQLGISYGNSNGYLLGGWGEVRGKNGIIVVSPTKHSKHSDGGRYEWLRTGVLSPLPEEIQMLLRPIGTYSAASEMSFPEVEEWIASYNSGTEVGVLTNHLEEMEKVIRVGSRHEAARKTLLATMKDVRAGFYPAIDAINGVLAIFLANKPIEEWTYPREYQDIVKWVISVIKSIPQDEIDSHAGVHELLSSPSVMNWIRGSHVK